MSVWEMLFERALRHLDAANITTEQWRFGGGTVLMLYFNHRLSKDIDIFLADRQLFEIVAKKLHYRGTTLKPRDIFDMATLWIYMPEMVCKYRDVFIPHATTINKRIEDLKNTGLLSKGIEELDVLEGGKYFNLESFNDFQNLIERDTV